MHCFYTKVNYRDCDENELIIKIQEEITKLCNLLLNGCLNFYHTLDRLIVAVDTFCGMIMAEYGDAQPDQAVPGTWSEDDIKNGIKVQSLSPGIKIINWVIKITDCHCWNKEANWEITIQKPRLGCNCCGYSIKIVKGHHPQFNQTWSNHNNNGVTDEHESLEPLV